MGWMVAQRELATLAERLIEETCERQGVTDGQLTLHADRGPSMRSKNVALLLADLGVTKTHSRPYTSTDNPFSEAQFRTMKWHGGLAMLTPRDVHHGLGARRLANRAAVLAAAYVAHPERFPHGVPTPGALPQAVWINKPVRCGCEEEGEPVGCLRNADLETPSGRSTPESAMIKPSEEEMLLVTAH